MLLQNITITDITKKAGVSRMTYYRAFSSKEDILIQYFNKVSDHFMQEIRSNPDMTLQQLAVRYFAFFREHRSLIPTLQKANLLELGFRNFVDSLKRFYTYLFDQDNLNTSANYRLHFNAGGLAVMLVLWSENGYEETPEQMAQIAISSLALPLSPEA